MNIKSKIRVITLVTTIGIMIMGANIKIIDALNNQTSIIRDCKFLNIRKGPSTKYSVVSKVYENDTVSIIENDSNGWVKIKTKSGASGWVNGKFINQNTSEKHNNSSQVQNNQNELKIKKLISVANKQLGKPYKWGSSGPNSFDCSGFTYYVYKNSSNISLPRTSKAQAKVGKTISKKDLKPGDLVFFNTSGKGISHVGIYTGDSKFIHSPTSGKSIKYENINSNYYSKKFVIAKRIL